MLDETNSAGLKLQADLLPGLPMTTSTSGTLDFDTTLSSAENASIIPTPVDTTFFSAENVSTMAHEGGSSFVSFLNTTTAFPLKFYYFRPRK